MNDVDDDDSFAHSDEAKKYLGEFVVTNTGKNNKTSGTVFLPIFSRNYLIRR